MASAFLYVALLSASAIPFSSAQETATVPILDWGFDFPGSAISVIGQTSGSTTYRLTCDEPGQCLWTQVPTMASYLEGMVGTMTFVEAGAPYNAAMTQNISAGDRGFSYRATCTPRAEPVTMIITNSEGKSTERLTRPSNLADCTSASAGQEPTPTFELTGTTAVYKMVVVTQGVEKLSLGAVKPTTTPLVTTAGAFDPQNGASDSSSSSTSTDTLVTSTQPPESAADQLVVTGVKFAASLLLAAFVAA
ncbi:hypothetical protein B0T21DRAFT_115277 [Apiosordaria backusii]|uniref:Uncharacterized protein n=1 Tax=Apiosordaria backusii TaxID=314023 RepID=A0AA40DIQ8_9PEZI|nr:hypothetical protein B0T21DRAFT_115277 [Apiosordaria backusii]